MRKYKRKYIPKWYRGSKGQAPYVLPYIKTSSRYWDQVTDDMCAEVEKTCIVVGSSSYLRGSKLGKIIDNHDIIIRFNDAPTET